MTRPTPLPDRFETPRTVIRRWAAGDEAALSSALAASWEHLQPWVPWAFGDPPGLDATKRRVERWRAAFDAGEEYVYGVFDPSEVKVLGAVGLHARVGDGALEIGYWVHAGHEGRGLATEAAGVVTEAGLAVPGVRRVELHCSPGNRASVRVAEKLGYTLAERRVEDYRTTDGVLRDMLIFLREPG